MNTARRVATPLALALAACLGSGGLAQPLSTGFTYQGAISQAGQAASGVFDLRFRLYDSPVGGSQFGPTFCVDNVTVQNGSFAVSLDFGSQFAGQTRYLEIELRPDTGLNCGNPAGFTVLSPRQELSASPNAAFSLNAGSLGGQPGSYYLTAPLAGTPGKFGIKIYASNVTIDLGGFELVGSPGTTWAGIATGPGVAGLSIRDGVLSGWGSGIDLANADGCTFERLRVVGGREQGFYAGAHACITDCISSGQSQGGGIFAGLGSVITRCRTDHNGAVGISAGSGSTISDCSASDNVSAGFFLDEGCTLRACSGYRNGQHGAFAFYGCLISACSFRGNVSNKIACALARRPPPKRPCKMRATVSIQRLTETPQRTEAAVKPTSEKMKYRFFPNRWPSHADSGRMMTFAIA